MAEKPRVIITTAGGHIAPFEAGFIRLHDLLGDDYRLEASVGGVKGLEDGISEPINPALLDRFEAGAPYGADRNPGDIGKIVANTRDDDIIIMMGGDNHLKTGRDIQNAGVNVIGYPKTMDGDTFAFITCGWDTAVYQYATAARHHHRAAAGYKRVFFVGEFGRDRDGVLIPSTAWGGADRGIPSEGGVLSWEDHVLPRILESYEENGKRYKIAGVEFPFAVVTYSEGTVIDVIPDPPRHLQSRDSHGEVKLQPEWIGMNLVYFMKQAGISAAFQAYTYSGRDFPPTATDVLLSEMACEEIAGMVRDQDFGKCAMFEPQGGFYVATRAPLEEVGRKKSFRDSGLFDYEQLVPDVGMLEATYGNLFRQSLGRIPNKDDLVHKTMQQAR